ncbi:hypothetical protein BCF55_0197 [Hydrogenivirga caldilitoris]|uniref:Uncharacterized protein n=1 Tax=Hydrogenivirga caldilitoris TaxID=246264 RepID=A0A497XMB1_9AQUI|nr:hypothetical protein [Hydrogenivirga caldilitoris]RLJ69938.1 hypothetical protein BCF55_0197 [Hydrogenivirga caldilitoris]
MKKLLFFALILVSLTVSKELDAIKDFFNRKGYVVEKLGNKVILDLGKGKVNVGEVFTVLKEGRELVHPVTGEVLGKVEEEVGKVKVSRVEEKFSEADILEDKGIEKGDPVKLYYQSICYLGSEEGFFKVSSLVGNLQKGEACDYLVREFEEGYGIEYKGLAVDFYEKPKPKVIVQQTERVPEEFKLQAKFLIALPSLPLSADACSFFGRDYAAVLFENRLVIYELLEKEFAEYASMNLPSGYPVSLQCIPTSEGDDLIVVNQVVGSSVNSFLVRMVGGSPVIVARDIPFFVSVLDKERPKDTLVGQKFDGRNFWGEVKRLEISGNELIEKEAFKVPSGFRIDSAVMLGDLLVFTDRDGYLRVYKGDELLLSEENFSGSYTVASMPDVYQGENKYTFNTRHFITEIAGKRYVGVVKNVRSPIYKFLDVTKFTEGELFLVLIDKRGIAKLKQVTGKKFEEAIQSVFRAKGGRTFVITGRTGTLPVQNRGDVFEIEIESLQ